MPELILVKANGHGPVAREDNPRRYIGDEPMQVPLTTYYIRRMMDGELVEVPLVPKSSKKGGE